MYDAAAAMEGQAEAGKSGGESAESAGEGRGSGDAPGDSADRRLHDLEAQIARLQERKAAIEARRRERERKRDARCKILLGAGLVRLVRNGDEAATAVYRQIKTGLDERAAKAFEGWVEP